MRGLWEGVAVILTIREQAEKYVRGGDFPTTLESDLREGVSMDNAKLFWKYVRELQEQGKVCRG